MILTLRFGYTRQPDPAPMVMRQEDMCRMTDRSCLLNWLKVRELRDQAVRAAELRVDAIDQAEAGESSQSRGYGTTE